MQYRVEFSTVVSQGMPYVTYHILAEDECWHDAVRGDGKSYHPSGREPETLYQQEGETVKELAKRANAACDAANAQED